LHNIVLGHQYNAQCVCRLAVFWFYSTSQYLSVISQYIGSTIEEMYLVSPNIVCWQC